MKFFNQNSSFFLHRAFARVSPLFAWTIAFAAALVLAPIFLSASESGAEPSATVKRQSAEAQFTRAEEQRAALTAKPAEKRTLAEYRNVVASYKKVYLITPHAADVQDSLLAVGELYTEMGDRFGRVYYQSAVESYQFLLREYPKSRFAPDVLLRTAKLQQNNLGDTGAAMKTYQDFLKRFPRSEHKREAQESLAELSLLQNSNVPETNSAAAASAAPPEKSPTVQPTQAARNDARDEEDSDDRPARKSNGIPAVKTISATSTGDSTRITIALEDAVQYISGRIANPDRIYFDLHAAKLSPQLKRGGVKISGNLVSNVRVAQNASGVVRIVLDLNGVKDYTASLLSKPSRLIIDLYATPQALRAAKPADAPATTESAKAKDDTPALAAKNSDDSDAPAETKPLPAPRKELPTAEPAVAKGKDARGKSAKNASSKPDLVKAPSVPAPTRDGQATLTRALGLKIGRIVIDAGHGGHDTGTIGPTGLMEKDLCLDVALRLGKIIQQKLPGADVVYTRPDDTFVPLEERTRIANEAKADLFISIHANSSHDAQARGIETYYLNLKGSAEAMEVAARENASSSDGIHDLEDIVKRIARTEKIDESKEFARDVQESLSRSVQKSNRLIKDRGVRKAPFVVLIGADMPSILTEISFLSNPSDEQMLKKPEQRQRVAEGIYQGVAGYLQSLNSMTLNLQPGTLPRRPPVAAAVEESRNQK
ncbi:MAG TPA: N-acetylmuramoyl-L-alanine amidase [Candidatus Acidoferrum sp.]|nr:N-acetylmuramoyl-L-alanine amidase [Candidatus Acidoferrum sp.]